MGKLVADNNAGAPGENAGAPGENAGASGGENAGALGEKVGAPWRTPTGQLRMLAAEEAGPMEAGQPVSISEAAAALTEPWQPRDLALANDAVVRIARRGAAVPGPHHQEDDPFLCWDGGLRVELEGRDPVTVASGELFVVPRGTRHRPVAARAAHALMLERPETKQYGN